MSEVLDVEVVDGVWIVMRVFVNTHLPPQRPATRSKETVVGFHRIGAAVEGMIAWYPHYTTAQIEAALRLPEILGPERWGAGIEPVECDDTDEKSADEGAKR